MDMTSIVKKSEKLVEKGTQSTAEIIIFYKSEKSIMMSCS